MTPVYDLSLPGEKERLNATLIRREPAEMRYLSALALKSREERQKYVHRVRAKHGEEAARDLVRRLKEFKR